MKDHIYAKLTTSRFFRLSTSTFVSALAENYEQILLFDASRSRAVPMLVSWAPGKLAQGNKPVS